jgi:hypothetical protein
MMRLDLKVLLVGAGNGLCGRVSNVVAVHKDRHAYLRRVLFYTSLHTALLIATV